MLTLQTIYVENSSENDRSAAEVMVHGNFRCKIDVPTDLSSANFSFRLHSIPIKSMCSRELRIAVYADKTAVVPIVISRPFRNVAYKITMIHEPFLTAFPPSNGMYCYEEAKRPLVFKIALSSCSPDSVVPDVNVMLNLSIVDLKGSPRPDLTVNNPHDPAWWNVERENSSEGVSEYVSLPAILRCTLKISSPELVCIRVMVQSVSGAAMSPVEIGACDTSAFTIGALTAVEGLPPRNIPAEIMCSVDRTSNLNQLPIPAVMSTAVPAEFEGDGPKEKLMRWIHASMVALHTARSTKQFSDLNKELIFDALAK